MRWAMVALVGSLAGCGGGPAAAPPGLSAPLLRGGAWRAGCVAGPVAWAARDGAVERWRFGPDGPAQEAVIPLGGAPRAVGCDGERALVAMGEADAVGVAGDAVAWRGALAAATGWPTPAGAAGGPLPDGRELRWSGPALALLDAGETIWRRDAATGLQAATWDGERVWAAGASGVWWWRPGPGAPVPMGQPPGLGPVARLFRDDALLWLVDASGRGLPVWPRGPWLVPAGPEGQVVAGDDRLQAPLGEATVEARLGAIGVALDGQGTPTPGAVQALVPLGEFLIVAAGEAVVVYRAEGGRLVEAGRRALPGPTVAMFLVGPDRLLLVGADYGFGELALTPSSGAPRTGHPAP